MIFSPGDLLRIPDARSGVHCWVLLLVVRDDTQVIGAMRVTERGHTDKTVLVVSTLSKWVSGGRATMLAPLDADVLKRAVDGACRSSRTPNDMKAMLGCLTE